jgi:hypothetical protein
MKTFRFGARTFLPTFNLVSEAEALVASCGGGDPATQALALSSSIERQARKKDCIVTGPLESVS